MSEAVNSSDYYERQYQRFEQELKLFLGAIAVPTSVVEEDQSLQEWYFFELRKKVLVEDRKGAFEESVRDKIEGPIRIHMTLIMSRFLIRSKLLILWKKNTSYCLSA